DGDDLQSPGGIAAVRDAPQGGEHLPSLVVGGDQHRHPGQPPIAHVLLHAVARHQHHPPEDDQREAESQKLQPEQHPGGGCARIEGVEAEGETAGPQQRQEQQADLEGDDDQQGVSEVAATTLGTTGEDVIRLWGSQVLAHGRGPCATAVRNRFPGGNPGPRRDIGPFRGVRPGRTSLACRGGVQASGKITRLADPGPSHYAPPQMSSPIPGEVLSAELPPRRTRVLVVDDEAAMREVLEARLSRWGYEVRTAETVAAAKAAVERFQPDVVVSDLVLPDATGLDLLEALQAGVPERTVLLITAYGTIDTAVKAMRSGATNFLTKPLDYQALKGHLEAAPQLGRRLVSAATAPSTESAVVDAVEPPPPPFGGMVGR